MIAARVWISVARSTSARLRARVSAVVTEDIVRGFGKEAEWRAVNTEVTSGSKRESGMWHGIEDCCGQHARDI